MTALKHAVKRRVHLERPGTTSAEPGARPRENRKQFLERARIAKEHKKQLAELQRKALLKNPNEFNFAMIRAVKKDNLLIERTDKKRKRVPKK